MEGQIISSLLQSGSLQGGAFTILFVWLLFTSQRKNEQRETKYQEVIEKNQEVIEQQAKAFGSLSKDVSEIKQMLIENK